MESEIAQVNFNARRILNMMSDLIQKLKWPIRPIFYSIKRRLFNQNRDWVLGRVACMGQDVFKLLEIDVSIINVQKGRVDYLNDISEHQKLKTRTNQVVSAIERDDIKHLIFQQQLGYGTKKKPPLMLYMDSFSELTDQRFYHKNRRWSFCANYSDINHSPEFERKFESMGLLPEENLYTQYNLFFSAFRKKYGQVPIVFLHFPVKLDNREKFKIRYAKIKEAIDKIKTEFQPFYSFETDENIVDWPEKKIPGLENFPYHYNEATYDELAKLIKQSGIFKEREI